jgi:hypothetical protein
MHMGIENGNDPVSGDSWKAHTEPPAHRPADIPDVTESEGSKAGRVALALKDYAGLTGVLGVVLYALLRIAYAFFYIRLRTTPEEVGYGYSRVISESIAGAVELVLLIAILITALGVLYYLGRITLLRFLRRSHQPRVLEILREPPLPIVRRVAARSVAIGAAAVFLALPALAWWQGGLAQRGQTVRNVYFIGIPYLPILAVQAVPAEVTWKDKESDKPLSLSDRKCLMYLGQSNGTTVFYDVRTHDSLRLPSGDITVTLRFAFFVPESCR